jgi:hypothetical protein
MIMETLRAHSTPFFRHEKTFHDPAPTSWITA